LINLFSVVWVELRDADKQRAVALAVNRALAGLGEESQFNVGVREARPGTARHERGGWEVVLEGPILPSYSGWRLTRVDGHPSVFYRRRLHGPDEENAAFLEETIERLVWPLKQAPTPGSVSEGLGASDAVS
jgi:hypothetical protein